MTDFDYRYGRGSIDVGWDAVFKPGALRKPDQPPVIMLHGADAVGATASTFPWNHSWPHMHLLAARLAMVGVPVVGGYMGANTYANDVMCGSANTSLINKALAHSNAVCGGTATKAHVIGVSMGGGCGIRWASLNPAKAASVTGMIPMASIASLFRDNPNIWAGTGSFTKGIADAWGLVNRTVTDAVVTSGSQVMTSSTANFTAADVGRQVARGYTQTGIPTNTKILSRQSATQVTLDKSATASQSGVMVTISDPLPMSGTGGADLVGVHAPRLASNNIPTRLYYASDDPYIYPSDVTALATAAGGQALNAGARGHDNDVVAWAANRNGVNHDDLIDWLLAAA